MKLKEIGISVSRTFNLGNFESLRVEATVAASVEDENDIDAAKIELLAEVRETLRRAYLEFRPKPKEGSLDV
jgi:hypothetical protein